MSGCAAQSFALMGLHIGAVVVQRMDELGMSQTRLADRMGVARRTLIRWLDEPHWDTSAVEAASVILEMNLYELLARELASRLGGSVVSEPAGQYVPKRMIKLTVEMEDDPQNRAQVMGLTHALRGQHSSSWVEQVSKSKSEGGE